MIFTEAYFVKCFSHVSKEFVFHMFNPQLFSPVLQIPDDSDFLEYIKIYEKEYTKERTIHQKTILDSLFIILLSKTEQQKQYDSLQSNDTKKSVLFQQFIALLATNYRKERGAIFYATSLAITYKYLNEVCKAIVNKTAKSVINDYIILQAKRSLINSSIKSAELAYQLGFEDPTNFTKYFKKYTGYTPKSFRLSVL